MHYGAFVFSIVLSYYPLRLVMSVVKTYGLLLANERILLRRDFLGINVAIYFTLAKAMFCAFSLPATLALAKSMGWLREYDDLTILQAVIWAPYSLICLVFWIQSTDIIESDLDELWSKEISESDERVKYDSWMRALMRNPKESLQIVLPSILIVISFTYVLYTSTVSMLHR